uniref:Uncharacterized protein n=1 Tax=Arundo donax TaxID=35708 RepID=A0A0A9BTL6_ARUDO
MVSEIQFMMPIFCSIWIVTDTL